VLSLEGGSKHLEIHGESASDRLKPGLHTLCPSFACEICGLALLLSAGQAFRQGREFAEAAVGLPDNAAVVEQAEDFAVRRTAQGLDAVAGLEGGRFAKAFDDSNHALPIEHAGDVVGDGGHHLAAAAGGQIGENEVNDCAAHISERVAVEEQEGSPTVTVPEELYGFVEGEDFALFLTPLCFSRSIAL
jgi:hypothetical protein